MKHIFNFVFSILILAVVANAQSGTLDSSFRYNGKSFYKGFGGTCTAIALQKDGKIVTGGNNNGFLIARFNTDGSLDRSFGDGGKASITDIEGFSAGELIDIAIQDDGKIVATGGFFGTSRYYDIGIIRLNMNGTLDSTFDDNGIVSLSLGIEDDIVGGLVLQGDGKILIAGKIGNPSNEPSNVYIVRYRSDGSLDKTFGDKGIASTPEGSSVYQVNAVALQTDGKILVGGRFFSGSLALLRYLPDGSLDHSFDEDKDGVASIRFEDIDLPNCNLYDVTPQTDGKILIGAIAGSNGFSMTVGRFNSDGSVDTAFGDKVGYSVLPMSFNHSVAYSVDVQSDKKILLIGDYSYDGGNGFGAARYNVDGSLDSSFGENGVASTSFQEGKPRAVCGVMQKDGKIIVGGAENSTKGNHIALVRFNNEIIADPAEFAKIKKWQGHYGFTWEDWPGNKTTYYSVGRSTNASTFSEIAQVADVPGQKKYQFEDPAPPAGIVYYQLTAIRSDGKTVNSNIISAGTAVAAIKLFPNPAKNSYE